MRKRVLALLVASAMLFSMLAGCGNKVDLSAYDGIWAEEDLNYENGGFIMTVTTDDDVATLFCEYADEDSGTTSGGVSKEITSKDIQKNVVTIEDAEDDWGNVVDMNITFNEDTIVCEVTGIKDGDAIPVFYKGTYTLVRNEDALQILSETPWEEAMGVKADDYSEEPVYDTSKASGILASLGMTEEQFKASCIPMQKKEEAPNATIWWNDTEKLNSMLDYPADYMNGFCYFARVDVEDKSMSTDGYPCYTQYGSSVPNMRFYDFRDKVNYPTISNGDNIATYAIYRGIQTTDGGNDYLCFHLISVEKNK